MTIPTLTLQQAKDGRWWINGLDDCSPMGPYNNKAEAEADRRGVLRTYRHHNEPGFVTSDPPQQ